MPLIRASLGDRITFTWQTAAASKWKDEARCAGHDPKYWDPDIGTTDELREGRNICDDCPVKSMCIEEGYTDHETAMIRGGVYFGLEGLPTGMRSAWGLRRGRPGDRTLYAERVYLTCPACERTVLRNKNGKLVNHRIEPRNSAPGCRMSGQELLDETA